MTAAPEHDLFAYARWSDPQTSFDAAASVTHISEAQNTILHILKLHGPLTDEQIFDWLCGYPISPSGARSRRNELVKMGKVLDTGERRLTRLERKSVVWMAR